VQSLKKFTHLEEIINLLTKYRLHFCISVMLDYLASEKCNKMPKTRREERSSIPFSRTDVERDGVINNF